MEAILSLLGSVAFIVSIVYCIKLVINKVRGKESHKYGFKIIGSFVVFFICMVFIGISSSSDDSTTKESETKVEEKAETKTEKPKAKVEETTSKKEETKEEVVTKETVDYVSDEEMRYFIGNVLYLDYQEVQQQFDAYSQAVSSQDGTALAQVFETAPDKIYSMQKTILKFTAENKDKLTEDQLDFLSNTLKMGAAFKASMTNLQLGLKTGESSYIQNATSDVQDVNTYTQAMMQYMNTIKK